MSGSDKPLSALVAQGWEIVGFAGSTPHQGSTVDSFLLRRLKVHKVLRVRRKVFGGGYSVTEQEI
ncbi:MAG: hypothetical protein WCI21_01875 [Alphaproteobacteria bacterium]